jgi:hypothetical protein
LNYPLGVATKFLAVKNKFSKAFALLVVCAAFLAFSAAVLADAFSACVEKHPQGAGPGNNYAIRGPIEHPRNS